MYCILSVYTQPGGVFFRSVKPMPVPEPSKVRPSPCCALYKKKKKKRNSRVSVVRLCADPIRPQDKKENSKGAASKCVRDLTDNKGKKKETERER